MKRWVSFCAAAVLTACGTTPENDPIYQALRANQPTEIPAKHLPKLRGGRASCDVYNEGRADQYMTCWWPSGLPVQTASLSYYGAGLTRPRPENIIAPGGIPVSGRIPVR
jgi:hypothetical protein